MKYIIILILMSFLITWVVRSVLKFFAASIFQRVNEQARREQYSRTSRKEGDVHIENNAQQEKKIKKNMGEYVDYEEIK